jgi:hypothetical protein
MDSPGTAQPGCKAVNDHISKPIPARLWHYTDFGGFQGIFTSKKIWATDYRFLNDREEFRHAKQIAQELIGEEPELTALKFPSRDYLRRGVEGAFNTGPLHESRLRIMVASFSEEEINSASGEHTPEIQLASA